MQMITLYRQTYGVTLVPIKSRTKAITHPLDMAVRLITVDHTTIKNTRCSEHLFLHLFPRKIIQQTRN